MAALRPCADKQSVHFYAEHMLALQAFVWAMPPKRVVEVTPDVVVIRCRRFSEAERDHREIGQRTRQRQWGHTRSRAATLLRLAIRWHEKRWIQRRQEPIQTHPSKPQSVCGCRIAWERCRIRCCFYSQKLFFAGSFTESFVPSASVKTPEKNVFDSVPTKRADEPSGLLKLKESFLSS